MAKAPVEGSLEGYPETFRVRYRYECDGSIVVSTPRGPLHFDDWMDFWAANGRATSLVGNSKKAVGSPLPSSERRLRALTTMLSALVLVIIAHEFVRDVRGEPKPDRANAEVSIETTSALGEAGRQDGGGSKPDTAGAVSGADNMQGEQAEKPAEGGVAAYERDNYASPRLAAEQGNADAQFAMGRRYEDGQGVPSNYIEAIKWYRLAAEQGHATAQYNLGLMYGQGRGAPPDFIQAHKWMSLAASGLPASETASQVGLIQNRDVAAVELTPAQLVEAQRLVREWEPAER